jgi:hypothetical protein
MDELATPEAGVSNKPMAELQLIATPAHRKTSVTFDRPTMWPESFSQ